MLSKEEFEKMLASTEANTNAEGAGQMVALAGIKLEDWQCFASWSKMLGGISETAVKLGEQQFFCFAVACLYEGRLALDFIKMQKDIESKKHPKPE